MTPLDQYLNNATRGIFGKRKLEIREELESDILERSRKFQLLGFQPQHAINNAIQELGDARAFSNDMKGIYIMPNLIRSGFLATVIFAGTVAVLSSSNAQIAVTPIKGSATGVVQLYLDVKSLVTDLTKAGLSVNQTTINLEMKLGTHKANLLLDKINSRVFQGRKEVRFDFVFAALEKAGIPIQQINNTEKLEYQINGNDLVFDTNSEVSQGWNLTAAQQWATAFISSNVPTGRSGTMMFHVKNQIADSAIEGTQPELAGKIVTASVIITDPQPPQAKPIQRKSLLLHYSVVGQADANGHFRLEIPTGNYLVATEKQTGFKMNANRQDLELINPNQGVIILGVRTQTWALFIPKTFQRIQTHLKTIQFETGKTIQLP